MIQRTIEPFVRQLAGFYPVVTILGPRQSGKTTLAKALFPTHEYRSLEAEDIRLAARDDPRGFLANGTKPMVIDEVQRFPALLTYIQEIVDARAEKGQFILTGSQQPDLAAAIGESLAGRTGLCDLLPLSLDELAAADLGADASRDALLWRGFMPRLWADDAPIDPPAFYRDYFQTYVQRDIRRLVNIQDLDTFGVFVRLLAGRAGQLLNCESLARDAGISVPTVVKWLNALEASFLVFRLRPWHANVSSRQIKSPKIYFAETGLAAWLVGIRDESQIAAHPLVGCLFENLVVAEARKFRLNRGLDPDMWFYRNATGTVEVDLLLEAGGRLHPREIKSSSTYSPSFRKGFSKFAAAVPSAAPPKIVYSGQTLGELAVDFRETTAWCP
ncbi:MAG: ATP-binding protein [Kiritimatiellae bacterium]|nr:ATP-binding protein [Kiritimatiellia bacterium]